MKRGDAQFPKGGLQKDRYYALFEASTDAIFLETLSGQIIDCNSAACQMFGYTRKELIKLSVIDLVPEEVASKLANIITEKLASGSAFAKSFNKRKDGSVFPVEVSTRLITVDTEKLAIAYVRDISDSQQAEAALQKMQNALKRRADEMAVLHSVSLEITAAHDLPVLLETIVQQAMRLLNGSGGSFHLCDAEKQEVRCAVCYRALRDFVGVVLKYGEGIAGKVAQTGQPLIINDYHTWPGRMAAYEAERPFRAVISVPVLWRGEVTGVLHVVDESENRGFNQDDIELLTLLASQAAIAIENARLLESERVRRQEAETLRQATTALTTTLNLNEVLDNILNYLEQVIPYNGASVFLLEDQYLHVKASRNLPDPSSVIDKDFPADDPLFAEIQETHRPVILQNIQDDPRFNNWGGVGQVKGWMGIPMIWQNEVIGYLTCDNSQPNAYTTKDAALAEAFASQAAIAIQNARLFEAERAQLLLSRTLQEVGALLTSQFELEEVLENILDLLGRVIGYDSASIHLIDSGGELFLAAGRGYEDPEQARRIVHELSDQMLANQWLEHEPLAIPDTYSDNRWTITPKSAYIRSWIGAPLLVKGNFIGSLNLDSKTINTYHASMTDTVIAFANQAAIAIENARLFKAEKQRAIDNAGLYEQAATERRHLKLLYDINREMVSSLDPDEIMDRAITLTCQALGSLVGEAFLYLPDKDRLSLRAMYGRQRTETLKDVDQRLDLRPGRGLAGWVAQQQEAANVPDLEKDPHWIHFVGVDENARSAVCAPILAENNLLGVLLVLHEQPGAFSIEHMALMQAICSEVGLALSNAALYEKVRHHAFELEHIVSQRTAELTELYELSQEIGYPLSFEDLLHLLLQHLRSAIACDLVMGCLSIDECRLLSIETNRAIAPGVIDNIRSLWAKRLELIDTERMASDQLRSELIWAEAFDENLSPLEQIGSLIQATIFIGPQVVGILAVGSERAYAFSAAQERLLNTFANQASAAAQRLATILTAQQRQLESLVEHLPVGVLLLDTDFRVLVANSAGREIVSVINAKPDSLNGVMAHLGSYTIDELLVNQSNLLPVEIIVDGFPRRIFTLQIRPAGAYPSHSQRHWVLTLNEITKERESLARTQIQERLATVGQLASGIAHDFNNIMAAILVYTDLLRYDQTISAKSQEKLAIIQQQIQRASSLIRQILDFSRKSVMEQSKLDLLPLVKELDKMLARVLPETIHIELSYQPGSYWVNGDPARLQQVFMNLALNARDAMPKGGTLHFQLSTLSLSSQATPLMPEMPSGNWIRISITDTGNGMTPEVRQHLFEPFFTTKPVGLGTGLGLAQVYGIVKQHDGHIDVYSQVGQGTTFTIYLPALEADEKKENQAQPFDRLSGQGEMVLLVEDDEATRKALRVLLETSGYKVTTANNGFEALQRFEEDCDIQGHPEKIKVVISDMVMPHMGGLDLYHALKERSPEIKMLLVTGHPFDDKSQALLEAGKVRWLQKPFSTQAFTQTLKDILQDV